MNKTGNIRNLNIGVVLVFFIFKIGLLLVILNISLAAENIYYSIKLEVQTEKDILIEHALYLDDNLSEKVNLLQLSPSLFAAYTPVDTNKTRIEGLFEKFRKVFLSAYIEKINLVDYNSQIILNGITQNNEIEVNFSLGSSKLNQEAQEKLDNLTKKIESKNNTIYIHGHSDSIAIKSAPYKDNLNLSHYRAINVKDYIIDKLK